MASHDPMLRLLQYPIGLGLVIFTFALPSASNALTKGPHEQSEGGPGSIPEVKTTVSIGLGGVTYIDIYCAYGKKKRPSHPQASGMIQVMLPNNAPPLVAGDGAKKIANQWIHDPDPLPQDATGVVFTCGNSRELPSGVYRFNWNAGWVPTPATCWSTTAFIPNVSGGIVVWDSDGKGGTIYIPKLKSTTRKVAPDHKGKKDKGKSRISIGAGEPVDTDVGEFLPTPAHVIWSQSGDVDGLDPEEHGVGNNFFATKPTGDPGSGTITADIFTDWGNAHLEKTFSVYKPAEVKTWRESKWDMGIGTVGAGMSLWVGIKPTNVSFAHIYVREKGKPGTPEGMAHDVTDFFQYYLTVGGPTSLDHDAEDVWDTPLEANNEFIDDAWCSINIWPPPQGITRSGSYHWKIPVVWNIEGVEAGEEQFATVEQLFSIDNAGTVTVEKREAKITRGINQTHGN